MIARGENWSADLGLPRGSAPALRRPVLVVSDEHDNRSRLRTATVVALTSNERLAALPGNVAIPAEVSGLERNSVVDVTQLATVDRAVLEERVGPVPPWILSQVEDGLRRALGL